MKDNLRIIAYYTHYQVIGYDMGDSPAMERALSTRDDVYYKTTYYFYYDEINKVAYLPRGIDLCTIREWFGKGVDHYVKEHNPINKMAFSMKYQPRDDIQKECVRFLLGRGEFGDTTYHATQLILALIGGGGKTYCAIAALSFIETPAIVVCHSDDIRKQWVERIIEYTNMTESNIQVVSSRKQLESYKNPDGELRRTMANTAFYITTHSLLHQYMMHEGFLSTNELFECMGIGVKIIDEFHKNFMNTLYLDYATNVMKTFYLSATPQRSDRAENAIFKKAFGTVFKLRKTAEDIGRERETIAIYDIFKTDPVQVEIDAMRVAKKFNVYKYIDYELEKGPIVDRAVFWVNYLNTKMDMSGKVIYVLSPKKDSCDVLHARLKKEFPDKKICCHYTGNKVDDVSQFDIVCATVKMLGTGDDIPNLKAIINLEPVGSEVNAEQLIHRLMRGRKGIGPTFYIDIIDKAIRNVYNMYKKRAELYNNFIQKYIVLDNTKRRR